LETLSCHDPDKFSVAFHDVEIAEPSSLSKSISFLACFDGISNPSLSSSSELLLGGDILGCVLNSVSKFPVPMNSMTALPNECESEVGGVLTMLLDPAVVDAKTEEMEDDDEEVDGELMTRGGTAEIPLAANI
jgi:hypothetical protein